MPFESPPISPFEINNNNNNTNETLDNIQPLTNLKTMEEVKPELVNDRRKSLRGSIDMTIFNDSDHCEVIINEKWLKWGAKRIKRCDFLNRLITGLKYYTNLDIENNDIDKDEFNNFFDDTYVNMLDDYLHVLRCHSIDLEEIHNSLFTKYKFKKVDINKCKYTLRHFKGDKVYNKNDDPWINFYIETYDSLYYYLFHLYSVGLRSRKKDLEQELKNQVDELEDVDFDEKECYDAIFGKMMKRINKKSIETSGLFTRYNVVNKYDLQITASTEDTVIITKDRDSERLTFKDSLMIYVQKCMKGYSNVAAINNLYQFVNDEEYDSDAIIQDIDDDHGEFSNIRNAIKNRSCIAAIKQYIRNTKRMFYLFYVFYACFLFIIIVCFFVYFKIQCLRRHSALALHFIIGHGIKGMMMILLQLEMVDNIEHLNYTLI